MGKIFSPGKLLLTSEYVVLDGALALAVPTQLGQEFFFDETSDGKSRVYWEAYHENKLWLKAVIDYKTWEVLETNISAAASFILKVLKNVQELSKTKFLGDASYFLKTNLQFQANFGLGSSSTLMNNLAEWASIDPFVLNDKSLGGSGYDIAVAKEKSALLFQIKNGERISRKIKFSPPFKDDLIFIYLNRKMNSREGISHYRSKEKQAALISEFSDITTNVLHAKNIKVFSELMELHEQKLSEFLGVKTAKDLYFKDCPVFVKSLGAWGGDFVMSSKFQNYQVYFSELGFSKIFSWNDVISW